MALNNLTAMMFVVNITLKLILVRTFHTIHRNRALLVDLLKTSWQPCTLCSLWELRNGEGRKTMSPLRDSVNRGRKMMVSKNRALYPHGKFFAAFESQIHRIFDKEFF